MDQVWRKDGCNDPNLTASFDGVVDLKKNFLYSISICLSIMLISTPCHLTKEYKTSRLSFYGNTNMIGNSSTTWTDTWCWTVSGSSMPVKNLWWIQLLFESEVSGKSSKFTITSDLINGNFEGDFKYSTIPQTISSIVENYIPALFGKNIPRNLKQGGAHNYMNIDLTFIGYKNF